MTPFKLSLVVPVYFEEECIAEFIKQTTTVCSQHSYNYEIVFIDDGSSDETVNIIKEHTLSNERIKLVELSYNHGKQAAVTAGVNFASGDYLLYMDPDLQDPPEEIPNFVNKIQEGYDLVFGIRKEKIDSLLNKLYSKLFWATLNRFTGLDIPKGLSVMRIFNKKFAEQFLKYAEQNRFIEGIFIHIGMARCNIPVSQRERFAGKTKYNFKRKMELAFNAIFDYSELPLKVTIKIGLFMVIIGLIALFSILITKLFFIEFQMGWPSMMSMLIFGFGLQILLTGVVGTYVGRIYKETKKRPLFSIKETHNL